MDPNADELTGAALRLPAADRVRLAEALLASLEGEDVAWSAEWLAEAERRGGAAAEDPSRVRSAAGVIAELRARYSSDPDATR